MASGQYPKWKGKLVEWAFQDGPPAGLTLCVALCGSGFVFNDTHAALTDLPGVMYEDFELPGMVISSTGRFDLADYTFEGLTPNDQFTAVVFYWKWAGGTQLWLYTTESVDQPLPIEIVADTMRLKIAAQGLFQL